MSWGWKITILYGSFVAMMVTLVIMSARQDIPMVTEDYYEKDLQYETHMVRVANSRNLEQDVTVVYNQKTQQVTVAFPNEITDFSGEILCFRPSQEGLDFTLPIENLKEKTLTFRTSEMMPGRWKVKIDWEGDSEIYYKEIAIFI
jgi:hypothetical protein